MQPHHASILVVDDDVDTCRNLADILGDLAYHVEAAHDGPSALELVRRRHFDVALLDLKMPGMDGLELYRAILEKNKGGLRVASTPGRGTTFTVRLTAVVPPS